MRPVARRRWEQPTRSAAHAGDGWGPAALITVFERFRVPVNSEVLGQVMNYLELMDLDADRIVSRDHEDVSKIRAKIIIGRDDHTPQGRAALRRLNAHLHRIEILTYDQLVKIAERTLNMLGSRRSLDASADRPDPDLPPVEVYEDLVASLHHQTTMMMPGSTGTLVSNLDSLQQAGQTMTSRSDFDGGRRA